MNCYYHKEKEGTLFCSYCGNALCEHCVKDYKGKVICVDCLESKTKSVNDIKDKGVSRFWTFMFSLVPGAGHMYLGLMKRGLQLMLMFVATIILSSLSSRLNILLILLAVEWFYSFFDCHHYKKRINMGEIVVDEEIIKSINISKYHLGIILLVLGGIILIDQFFSVIHFVTNDYRFTNILRDLVFPIILIIVGLTILYKNKAIKLNKTDKISE